MLFDALIDYCDKKYQTYGEKCGNVNCSHPSGNCTGSCYNCLYEIHYPKDKTQKMLYDCPKMLYHYVCQYSSRYASEIQYVFNLEKEYLKNFSEYKMMSIGCGGCPDLMAIEKFMIDNGYKKQIDYRGYDVNDLWIPIHRRINKYCENKQIIKKFIYEDAIQYFSKYYNINRNIIVISYLLSYLYNTGQKKDILIFFDKLIDNVILRNKENKLILFNDVNSCYRGRDYFIKLVDKLKKAGLHGTYREMYFDTGILNKFQKTGDAHISNNCLFVPETKLIKKYHVEGKCRSSQLIIEVTGK